MVKVTACLCFLSLFLSLKSTSLHTKSYDLFLEFSLLSKMLLIQTYIFLEQRVATGTARSKLHEDTDEFLVVKRLHFHRKWKTYWTHA